MAESTSLLARLARVYDASMTYFIPADLAADPNVSNQARMFLLSHYLGPILGMSVPLALFLVDPTPSYEMVILAASILSFWAFPFLLRAGVAYNRLVLLSIAIDWFVIFWSCFFYGGAEAPTVVWFLIIPILAVFYIGDDPRQKRDQLLLGVGAVGIFAAFYLAFGVAENDVPEPALELLGAVSVAAVMAYVALMAIYYSRIFDAGVDLEREVARRRLMAIELQRSVEAADRASTVKSEFLARMTHELRSPLNAIIGYGELLLEEFDQERDRVVHRDLDRIVEAGGYLTRLIDQILSLAKMDAGKLPVNARCHDLREIVEAVVGSHHDRIADADNSVTISIAPEVAQVTIDRDHLVQIVDIIVKNAVSYTANGSISIDARAASLDDVPAFEVSFTDTGAGIEPEILSVIFETFLVDREAAGSRYGGTGLALSVAKKLCELMHGTIVAESVLDHGSTFTICLPMTPPASPATRVESREQSPATLRHGAPAAVVA